MFHYRDARAGRFYLNRLDHLPDYPSETPPFIRFARKLGGGLDLWAGEGATAESLLSTLGLHWSVHVREVLVPSGRGPHGMEQARGYRALVRPDNEQIMSIVTIAYSFAENDWVALATEQLASRLGEKEPLTAAVSFGRNGERTLFAARVTGNEDEALCLLAHNTHGGEGAVRFQLVQADRRTRSVYVLDSAHATMTVPHLGDVQDRLIRASDPDRDETFIERYLVESKPLWDRLRDKLWTPRHSTALIEELWRKTPPLTKTAPNGNEVSTGEESSHYPGQHLLHRMRDCTDAANAYRTICYYLDNESEACERGDFTKDRDERLALGAANKFKLDAWRWIIDNT
jgi:hypothetical protein